jgi:DNA-binding transcriptional ArsR family regulator
MSEISSVRDVMPAPPRLRVEAEAGSALELLIGLFAATTPDAELEPSWVPPRRGWSPELRDAIEAVGERSGEAWLHLLGLALELPADDARSWLRRVARVPAGELRRHLVGVHVPAWTGMLGLETLERAARGEPAAVADALGHPRYYAGRARDALTSLLAVPAAETKRRLLAALRRFAAEALAPVEAEVTAALRAGAEETRRRAAELAPRDAIAAAAGYQYEPEPEFPRVVLVPHLAARPLLLLCQHRDRRVICHPLAREQVDSEEALAERAVALGRALGDARRVRLLRRLADGRATLDELASVAGLAKSTTHHHLVQLRAAGLVTLGGNARGYWYALRPEGLAEAQATVAGLATATPAPPAGESGGCGRRAPRARGTG